MISHAGHGSVLTALAYGVPLVCLPNPVADQPGIAHQVEALGAGRALDGDNATAEEIATAVREVLGEPSYAVEARQLAALISRTTGAASAADRLAQLNPVGPETKKLSCESVSRYPSAGANERRDSETPGPGKP
jgi:UDP:flavonoid glycosyltransferase YjiC (YdhE family)